MAKRRVFYHPDGKVSVMQLIEKARQRILLISGAFRLETDDEFYAREQAKQPKLVGLAHDDMDAAALPDREFRDKWRGEKGQGIRVDMSVVTLADRRKVVEDALDAELVTASPDTVEVVRLQRKLQKKDY